MFPNVIYPIVMYVPIRAMAPAVSSHVATRYIRLLRQHTTRSPVAASIAPRLRNGARPTVPSTVPNAASIVVRSYAHKPNAAQIIPAAPPAYSAVGLSVFCHFCCPTTIRSICIARIARPSWVCMIAPIIV